MREPLPSLLLVAAVALLQLAIGCEGGILGPLGGIRVTPFDSSFQFQYTDFETQSARPFEPPPPDTMIGSLLYHASVTPVDTSLGSDPMSLVIGVSVRNPTSDTIEVPFRRCTIWPEAYDAPQRDDQPIWKYEDHCDQSSYSVTFGPSDTLEFSFLLLYDVNLAYALPDGRYYWNAGIRHASDSVILRAGSGDVRLRVPNLRYRVRVRQDGHEVQVDIAVTNLNQETARITYGDCSLNLVLYTDVDRSGQGQLWITRQACRAYLAVRDLRPGAVLPFARTFKASKLRDTELEPGRYYLAVQLSHNWREYEFAVGTIQVW